MVEEHGRRFSLWTVLTTAAIVGSAMASGAWYVARARIDDEIRQYERTKDWQLPQLLADLRTVSDEVRSLLLEKKEVEKLRSRVPTLEQENHTLRSQLEANAATIENLTLRLDRFESDTFELQRGEAREIVPGEVVLGVKDAYSSAGRADVFFNGTLREVVVATVLRASASGTEYRITLLRVHGSGLGYDKAVFKVTRHPREPQKP